MKLYVASSWRNRYYFQVVAQLRAEGFEVYDFREDGFGWHQIDPDWEQWETDAYKEALLHPTAIEGYSRDFTAMQEADACVLVMPAGRSACIEAGWMVGKGKPLWIYLPERIEPDLMFKMANGISDSLRWIIAEIKRLAVSKGDREMKRAIVRVSTHLLLDFLGLPNAKVIRSRDSLRADEIELLLEDDQLSEVDGGSVFPYARVEIMRVEGGGREGKYFYGIGEGPI